MTTNDIDAIEMRTLAATREPWHVEYLGEHGYPQRIANDAAVVVATAYEGTQPAGNAEFIAAARKDVPALVAEVRRLRGERDNALRLAALTAEQEAANAQIIVDTRAERDAAQAKIDALTAELAAANQQIASMPAANDGPDETYLIWSNHHQAWWAPSSRGYRNNVNDAGRYTLAAARKEMTRGCGCCQAPEVPVLAQLTIGAGDRKLRSVIAAATKAVVEAGEVNRCYRSAVVTVELPAEAVAR